MKHDNFEGRVTRVNTGFDLDIIEGDTVLATGARREFFCQQYSSMFENVSFGK